MQPFMSPTKIKIKKGEIMTTKKQALRPKADGNLALQIDWSDADGASDVIALLANKNIVFEAFARKSPKKVVEIYESISESCDFGDPCSVIYLSAINSEALVQQLERQFRNAGFRVRLCYAVVDESWREDATITNGKVVWNESNKEKE
jgi:uncharacterized protein (DUF1697 family)